MLKRISILAAALAVVLIVCVGCTPNSSVGGKSGGSSSTVTQVIKADVKALAEEGDPVDEIIDTLEQEFPGFVEFIEDAIAALFGG
jgi:ABC-type glycerol-3-phosphate transport system substrate-binding protein